MSHLTMLYLIVHILFVAAVIPKLMNKTFFHKEKKWYFLILLGYTITTSSLIIYEFVQYVYYQNQKHDFDNTFNLILTILEIVFITLTIFLFTKNYLKRSKSK